MNVDINCDMGESFGAYHMGVDAEVMPYISSANIAYEEMSGLMFPTHSALIAVATASMP